MLYILHTSFPRQSELVSLEDHYICSESITLVDKIIILILQLLIIII